MFFICQLSVIQSDLLRIFVQNQTFEDSFLCNISCLKKVQLTAHICCAMKTFRLITHTKQILSESCSPPSYLNSDRSESSFLRTRAILVYSLLLNYSSISLSQFSLSHKSSKGSVTKLIKILNCFKCIFKRTPTPNQLCVD